MSMPDTINTVRWIAKLKIMGRKLIYFRQTITKNTLALILESFAVYYILKFDPSYFRYSILTHNSSHGCTLLISKKDFGPVGSFSINLMNTQHFDIWFRLASEYTLQVFKSV